MGIIKVLSAHEAHKIAAGEVIERPVHALKELIENSIDAGATTITIHAEDGGRTLLSVTDDGSGIAPDDLSLAVARHATSKITMLDDLASLTTHGFRGEALASIAAVSSVTITSREKNTLEAHTITAYGESISPIAPAAAPVGTTIRVERLFENVPVRRAFLKSRNSELRLLIQSLIPYALMHPQRGFFLYHEGRLIAQYPAVAALRDRYAQVVGNEIARAFLPITHTQGEIILTGGVVRPTHTRRDRSSISIAVNNRPIKSTRISSAIIRGFGQLLESGSYPLAFIHITVPPATIDVNVHPRKEDVLFLSPRVIEDIVAYAIRKTLEHELRTQVHAPAQHYIPAPIQSLSSPTWETAPSPYEYREVNLEAPRETSTTPINSAIIEPFVEIPDYAIIGQFATTYILLEGRDGLIVIDQHAAHERIMYEQLRGRVTQAAASALLFPEKLELTPAEVTLIMEHASLLEEQGISIDMLSPSTLIARTTPLMYKGRVHDVIMELLQALTEERINPAELTARLSHRIRAMMACKAAVKAGDQLNISEMRTIVETLYKTENFQTCPHGRPTQWYLNLADIERAFKRR